MFQFNAKTNTKEAKPDGQTFLSQAREQFRNLFDNYAENAVAFDSVEEYTAALEDQAWEIVEPALKASYANGVKRGRSANNKGRSPRPRPSR